MMRPPNQLLVWRAEELQAIAGLSDGQWTAGNCLASTLPGDRAVIYQSGGDAGVAAILDFATVAVPHPDLGFVAWGTSQMLKPAARGALMSNAVLNPVFKHIQRSRRLTAEQAQEIALLVEGFPTPVTPVGEPPNLDEEWRWAPAGDEGTWGSERAMQRAIRDIPLAWQRLGFSEQPEIERPLTGGRIDLMAPGLVAECKLHADTRALDQLDRYITQLRAEGAPSPDGDWHGLIVTARGWTREVAAAVAAREDVQLIWCLPNDEHAPIFTEIPDEHFDPFAGGATAAEVFAMAVDRLDDLIDVCFELAREAGCDVAALEEGDIVRVPDERPEDLEKWYEALAPQERAAVDAQTMLDVQHDFIAISLELGLLAGLTVEEARTTLEAQHVEELPRVDTARRWTAEKLLSELAATVGRLADGIAALAMDAGFPASGFEQVEDAFNRLPWPEDEDSGDDDTQIDHLQGLKGTDRIIGAIGFGGQWCDELMEDAIILGELAGLDDTIIENALAAGEQA